MSGYFFISYCFPIFVLMTGVFVLGRSQAQKLAASAAQTVPERLTRRGASQ
jgi:hypothetical protein